MNRQSLARILGVVGLLLAATAPITYLLGGTGLVAAKLVVAAGALASAAFLAGGAGARRFFTGRGAHFGTFTTVSALLVAAILAVANWAAIARPVSWDLTRDRLFTMSDDTRRTLASLPGDVEALAFYRADEPAHEPTRELLRRYADLSPRFRYRMVDPYGSPELVKRFDITEGGPRIVFTLGGTEKKSRAAEPTEEALTNGLVELTRSGARKVYVLGGHGEPGVVPGPDRALSGAAEALRHDGFGVEPLSLLEKAEVPADASVVLVVGPRKKLLPPEVKALQAFLDRGGKVGLYLEPEVDAGVDAILSAFGIEADDDVVVDPSQASQLFGGSAVTPVGVPVPGHPITDRAQNLAVVLPTARSLVARTDGPVHPQPLLLTTREAWGETDLQRLDREGRAELSDGEKHGQLPLAMVAVRPVTAAAPAAPGADAKPAPAGPEARLLVVGDSEFMDDRYAQVLGNLDFFLNGVAWLGEQPDRIVIRPKGREGSRLVLSAGQSAAVRFATLDALPLLLVGLGLAVWQVRRSR